MDQFSLALVCKRFLQVSSFVSFKTSWLVGSKVMDHNLMMETLLRLVKPVHKAALRRRPRPRKAWMTCVDCLQFRPTRKTYWTKTKKRKVWGEIEVQDPEFDYWTGYVRGWHSRSYLQCPECRYDEEIVLPRRRKLIAS